MDMYDVYVKLKMLAEKSPSDQQDAILALVDDLEKYLGALDKTSENTNGNESIGTSVENGHDIDQYLRFNCKYCHGRDKCDFYAEMKRAKSDGFDRIDTNLPYECENLGYGEIKDFSSQKGQEFK